MTTSPYCSGVDLRTDRLQLLPLSAESLQLYLEDPAGLERLLSMPVSRQIITERLLGAIRMKLDKMHCAPVQDHAWYTYWLIVVVEANFGAGLAGFKGIEAGKQEVEIGYGIDPEYQRQGYITEAVRALVGWAFLDPECQRVTAHQTLKSNYASLRVLENVGFRIFAEREDSFDVVIDRIMREQPHKHNQS